MPWPKHRYQPPGHTTATGYGYKDHQRDRPAALAAWPEGAPCTRCGQPTYKSQHPLHWDHHDWDKTRHIGFAHPTCNMRAGASKGAKIGNARRRTRRAQRNGYMGPTGGVTVGTPGPGW